MAAFRHRHPAATARTGRVCMGMALADPAHCVKQGTRMATYGKKSGDKVEKAMHERKEGSLKSGRSGKTVTSRKQAIAIGLSEARRKGKKVPRKRSSSKR
jgi:Family of unknown function (DUF6496)